MNSYPNGPHKVRIPAWIGGFLLMVAFASFGLPIGQELTISESVGQSQRQGELLNELSTPGTLGSEISRAFWVALYLAAILFLASRRNLNWKQIAQRAWPLVALIVLVIASAAWSKYPERVWINGTHLIGVSLLCLSGAVYYKDNLERFFVHTSLVLISIAAIQLIAILFYPGYGIHWSGRWQGLMSHPNTFGLLGALTVIFNWTNLSFRHQTSRFLSVIGILIGIIAVLGSNSVTSFIVMTLCISWFAILRMFPMVVNRPIQIGFFVFPLGYILGWLFVTHALEGLVHWLGRDLTFTGRIYFWDDAIWLISQKPLLGWGFDSHATAIAVTGFAFRDFHNGYLDIIIAGGAVGALLLAWIFVRTIGGTRALDSHSHILILTIVFLVASYNIAESTFLAPRNFLSLLLLFVFFFSMMKPQRQQSPG